VLALAAVADTEGDRRGAGLIREGMQVIVRLARSCPAPNRSLPETKVPLTNWR
jgi:hypothetical protein